MKKIIVILMLCLSLLFPLKKLFAMPPVQGTCCPELLSICVVGSFAFHDYYLKDFGPCSD